MISFKQTPDQRGKEISLLTQGRVNFKEVLYFKSCQQSHLFLQIFEH